MEHNLQMFCSLVLGIFEKLSTENDFVELSIDSTNPQGSIWCKKRALTAMGISRGGKTSKIHTVVDEKGRPRKIILTESK